MIETDVCIIGGGPGGLAAATKLALRGRQVVVVNDGPLMGYGIEGAFKSKSEFEITRQYVYASLRPGVFGKLAPPSFDAVLRGTERSAQGLDTSVMDRLERLGVRVIKAYASSFAALGSRVTLLDTQERVLSMEDPDLSAFLVRTFVERQVSYQYPIHSIMPHPSLMECLQGAAHIIDGDALAYEEGEEYDFFTVSAPD